MRNLIITINASTRKIETNKNFLGINGENLNGDLIVEFKDEFIDGFAYLEIFDGSQKYLLSMEKVEEHYVLPILSSLLATVGDLQCQIRVNSQFDANSVSIFKSEKFKLPVLEAINATETMPEQYPTWIEEADLKILNIQNNLNAEITAREQADANLQANKQDKLTQTQLDAVNSGIDSTKVAQIGTNTTNITNLTGRVGTAETNITNLQNKVDFIKSDVVSGLDWATFNTSNFNAIFGAGWDTQLGDYGCRANASDDTSGLATSLGFSGTYYVEFKIWYVGTNNTSLFITISDSGTKNVATANVLIDRNINVDIHSSFFSAYADIKKYNMCPSDTTVTYTTQPAQFVTLMTAPTNGVAYVRYALSGSGAIGVHLQTSGGQDLIYNTQSWNDTGMHIYNATFVMKKGQKLMCYENAMTYQWGSIIFVKSEEQS